MTDMIRRPAASSALLFLLLAGCSVSYSVDTSSDSVSESLDSISASFESFTSLSASSGSDEEAGRAAVQRLFADIAALTRICLGREATPRDFELQLGSLCSRYGRLDWENDTAVFRAIGSGLRQAGVGETAIGALSFLQTPVMHRNRLHIAEGFRSG